MGIDGNLKMLQENNPQAADVGSESQGKQPEVKLTAGPWRSESAP